MIVVELPWPHKWLNPNARANWRRKAAAVKTARAAAGWAVKAVGVWPSDPDIPQRLHVTAIFSPPDNRPRDLDNMLSSIKSYLDGISDIIGVDDSKWQIALRKEAPRKGGSVRIELESAT